MLQHKVHHRPYRQRRGVTSRNEVNKQIVHNHPIMHHVRMTLLGLNKLLQVIRRLGVKVRIFALRPRGDVIYRHTSDVAQVGRTNAFDGVLIEPEVEEGHLSHHAKVIQRCVCGGDGPVVIGSLGHVAEVLTEGRRTDHIPSAEGDPFAQVAGFAGFGEAGIEVVEELAYDLIDEGFDSENRAGGVVLRNGAFPFVVLVYVGLAEEVVDDMAANDGAVVVVEVGLVGQPFSPTCSARKRGSLTLIHLLSVPYIVFINSG